MPKLSAPRMYGKGGKGMWKTPAPKPLPEGYFIGTAVIVAGHTGQVWSKAPESRTWWVACDDGQFRIFREHWRYIDGTWVPVEAVA